MTETVADRRRAMLVCLDAADDEVVTRMMGEGRLPVLAELAERGALLALSSAAAVMPEANWPSVTTGCDPGAHGVYSWRVVSPGTASRVAVTRGAWRKPFWQVLREDARRDHRVVLVDVPFTSPLGDDAVTELSGWGLRDREVGRSWPPHLFAEAASRHRPHPRWINRDYERGLLSELRYLRELKRLARRRADLALELISSSDWDCAVINFVEPHYAGHAFFHHTRPDSWPHDPARARRMTGALAAVYEATDEGLGRLVDEAGPGVDVFVFSARGMSPSACSAELLPRVLVALGYQVPATPSSSTRWMSRAEWLATNLVPRFARHHLRRAVSEEVLSDAQARAWHEAIDWRRSRAVAESEPNGGFVRLNLAGREPDGIVEAEDCEEVLEQLTTELMALEDPDSGGPAIVAVHRLTDLGPDPRTKQLPDLAVEWSHETRIRRVRHPRVGIIHDAANIGPRYEHHGRGFLVAAGPSVKSAADVAVRDVDLAPTLLHLLGCAIPEQMDGTVLDGLIDLDRPVVRAPIDISADPFA